MEKINSVAFELDDSMVSPERSPEKVLFTALLYRSLLDFLEPNKQINEDTKKDKNRRKKDAAEWFFSNIEKDPSGEGLTFLEVCETLNLSAERIRKLIVEPTIQDRLFHMRFTL